MNDFLSNFEGDNYNKKNTKEKKNKKEKELVLDDYTPKYVEHEVEIDYNYREKKKKQRIIIIISSIILFLILVITIIFINLVKLDNFVGESLTDVKTWASKKKIELVVKHDYSLEYDENVIIKQDKEAKKLVWKKSSLTIYVSKGADPEEIIKIPELKEMTLDEVNKWIEDNKLSKVSIIKTYSDEVALNKVIDYTIKNDVEEKDFKRKDSMVISISKGSEILAKDIEVKDFKNKTKTEVEEWAKNYGVDIKYIDSDSDTVDIGLVISQSIKAGTLISKSDVFTVTISIGKAIIVPDYSKYTKDNASSASALSVNIVEKYSDKVSYGYLISQSIKAGTKVKDSTTVISLTYSIGRPYIDDLTELKEKDLPKYFYEFQSKGANITYTYTYVNDSSKERGTIKSASKYNEFVDMNTVVHIEIYK